MRSGGEAAGGQEINDEGECAAMQQAALTLFKQGFVLRGRLPPGQPISVRVASFERTRAINTAKRRSDLEPAARLGLVLSFPDLAGS
jgi:hypothetical protein